MISQTSMQGEITDREGWIVQQLQNMVDRIAYRFSKQSDTRRAAILGMLFGLLMCVIVPLIGVVIFFIASLGD